MRMKHTHTCTVHTRITTQTSRRIRSTKFSSRTNFDKIIITFCGGHIIGTNWKLRQLKALQQTATTYHISTAWKKHQSRGYGNGGQRILTVKCGKLWKRHKPGARTHFSQIQTISTTFFRGSKTNAVPLFKQSELERTCPLNLERMKEKN